MVSVWNGSSGMLFSMVLSKQLIFYIVIIDGIRKFWKIRQYEVEYGVVTGFEGDCDLVYEDESKQDFIGAVQADELQLNENVEVYRSKFDDNVITMSTMNKMKLMLGIHNILTFSFYCTVLFIIKVLHKVGDNSVKLGIQSSLNV